jgi:hypothetical protein
MLVLFVFSSEKLSSQGASDGQIWFDSELNYTHKLRHLFQTELSVQSLIFGEGDNWNSFNITPAYEYNFSSYFDVVSAVPLSYTIQDREMSTFEVRTMIGARVYFTPYRRYQLRLLSRWEYRWTYDNNMNNWDTGNRFRFRGEFLYPLNKPSYYSDNMYYVISDAEVFLNAGSDIPERFANRARFRLGLGYRMNYNLRMEALYVYQTSRNTIDDDFNVRSNIFRFRLKYYFK